MLNRDPSHYFVLHCNSQSLLEMFHFPKLKESLYVLFSGSDFEILPKFATKKVTFGRSHSNRNTYLTKIIFEDKAKRW